MTTTLIRLGGLCSLFMLAVLLSACNTTAGLGKDVQSAGEAIEETAEDVKDDID